MSNYISRKKCSICKSKQAKYFRAIKDKHYYICEDQKCNFLSLLRAGLMQLRKINIK